LQLIIFVKLVGFGKGGSVSKSQQSRLDSLELFYSEQDHTVQTLNDIVAQQGQDITRLNLQLEQIRAQLESLKSESTTEINSGFEIPPHY